MKSTRATEALVVLVACGDCTRTRQPSMRRDLAGQWEVVARPAVATGRGAGVWDEPAARA